MSRKRYENKETEEWWWGGKSNVYDRRDWNYNEDDEMVKSYE